MMGGQINRRGLQIKQCSTLPALQNPLAAPRTLKRPNRSICAETQPVGALCVRGQMMPTSRHTPERTRQTVNYFCPVLKGADFCYENPTRIPNAGSARGEHW